MTAGQRGGEFIIALVNAVDGSDAEFNRWYTEEHLPEVVRLPGILGAQRYALPDSFAGRLPYRYATIYEIEGSAAEAMHQIYTAEYATQSDSLDLSNMLLSPFAPLGAVISES